MESWVEESRDPVEGSGEAWIERARGRGRDTAIDKDILLRWTEKMGQVREVSKGCCYENEMSDLEGSSCFLFAHVVPNFAG